MPVGTLKLLADQLVECEIVGTISTETVRQALKKKNELKPWLKQSWCIPPGQSAEFVCAMEDVMEDVLEVYQRPYDGNEVLVCMDETSKTASQGDASAASRSAPAYRRHTTTNTSAME